MTGGTQSRPTATYPPVASAYGGSATGYGPATSPGTGQYQQTEPQPTTRRNPWIAALIGLLLAALIGGGVLLWVSNDQSSGGSGSTSTTSRPMPTLHPVQNETKIEGTTASGAIQVEGVYRPFTFELPEGWVVVQMNDDLRPSRSEFIHSDSGLDPETMVKVTVVAEKLNASSVDDHISGEMNALGSPAQLPGYDEISYEVSEHGNVLWQYSSLLQGADRRGFFYATARGQDILWKVITSGPGTAGSETADIATAVIQSFAA